jgi:hypothetical protein
MPKYVGVILLLYFTFRFYGCSQTKDDILTKTEIVITTEIVSTITSAPTSRPTQTTLRPTQRPIEAAEQEEEVGWVLSADAGNYLGQVITIRVELSHCAYKPNINGAPTFCNDQPYPDHSFTYLVWGEDWSHFDQKCVLVTGEIVEYDGKQQIVVEEEEQIIPCED